MYNVMQKQTNNVTRYLSVSHRCFIPRKTFVIKKVILGKTFSRNISASIGNAFVKNYNSKSNVKDFHP